MCVLYGIGVGPGSPDLLTLRAVRALHSAGIILTAASPKNDYSLALSIVRPHLKPDVRIERLNFPMTRDEATLKSAWVKAAHVTASHLDNCQSVAFLTLGDPLIYSTFAYLRRAIGNIRPETKVEIIPGITSFQAAAAKEGISLCEGGETLTIIPGILPEETLMQLLKRPGAAAILKVYRNYAAIAGALKATGRAKDCIMATGVEQEGESFHRGTPEEKPPYMTLIITEARERKG